jgi:hypothetical protein
MRRRCDVRLPERGRSVALVSQLDTVPDHSSLRFNADPVVHGGSNALLAAEVSLGRLN